MDGNVSLPDFPATHAALRTHSRRRPVLHVLADLVMGSIERARSRRMLQLLDDRMLRDIGIDRGSAQYESDKPFWR